MTPTNSSIESHQQAGRTWLWFVWLLTTGVAAKLEVSRFQASVESPGGVSSWLVFWNMETTLPSVLLLLFPVLVFASRHRRLSGAEKQLTWQPSRRGLTFLVGCVFLVAFACSWKIGAKPIPVQSGLQTASVPFASLPPAYHDEYSYLLQARTFLDGKVSYPGMAVRPDLFHQMHVLNERRTVSRYFPWTGAWIAPFEALGLPILGHWLAGALSAVLFSLALLELAGWRAAIAGGILIALSPGIAVFSNLLLAHHPTMLALSLFLWAFVRMMATNRLRHASLAGTGLALAMLGRPMTAAGFALPFGIWLLFHMLRNRQHWRLAIGFAVPLVCGFAVLAVVNQEATGSIFRTAYQEYTDTYTPRHRYGFFNAELPDDQDMTKVLTAYDEWATNLTPGVAMKNVWNRLFYSVQWSLGFIPLLFGILMAGRLLVPVFDEDISSALFRRRGLILLAASIVSLHIVHIPYWFDGIMHWHYVFETAPLLLLLAGTGLVFAGEIMCRLLTPKMACGWIFSFVAVTLLPGWVELPFFDNTSKVSAAVSEQAFSRTRFAAFRQVTSSDSITKPALIMIDERNSDPQLSYVINPPDLAADVLTCKRPETEGEIKELAAAFADRSLYVFEPQTMRFRHWPETTE